MKRITIDDCVYEVPCDWNELSKQQLISLIGICQKTSLTHVEIRLKFFLHCIHARITHDLGIGMFVLRTLQAKHQLFVDELTALLSVFDYLFDVDDEGSHYLSPKLVINHFPKVNSRFRKLYGPNDALDNITYDQFVWLQTWQSRMNDDDDAIDHLVNTIYKTKNGKQDVKNAHRISKTAKTAILWYYLGTLHFLSERFPHVFSGAGNEIDNIFDNQQRIIDSLAEGDVTKKMLVRDSLLYDALYSMEMAAIRADELDKTYKQ
jgi:hypothetical protein